MNHETQLEPKTSYTDDKVEDASDNIADGGWNAWSTTLGGFIMMVTTFGYSNSFGVYQDYYTRFYASAATASQISWVGSTQIFLLFGMGIVAGKLLDLGYFHHTIAVGSILYCLCLFMVSVLNPNHYYQIFLAQGLGMGIGAGLIYVPCLAIQAHHWRRHRGRAMGIVVAGSSIGGVIFPIMLNQLFKGSVGFKWGVRASGFLVLGLQVLGNLLLKENPAAVQKNRPKLDMKSILTDVPYFVSLFAVLLIDIGFFFPYFYIQLYAILHGTDPNLAFYLVPVLHPVSAVNTHQVPILNASAIPGRILPNILADRVGHYNVIIPLMTLSGILVFVMLVVTSAASLIVFALLYGFISGGIFSLCAPITSIFARHPSEVGVRFGIAWFVTSLGALMGTPVSGKLLGPGPSYDWTKGVIWSGVPIFAGTAFAIFGRQMVVKWKGTQRV